MNAFTAGQSLLRSWWGGQAAAPATPVLRPNFTLEAVKLVGRDRGRKVTVFDGLSAPQLAAVLSSLVFEARGGDRRRPPRMPDRASEAAQQELRRVWRDVGLTERDHRLERGPEPDIGFAESIHAWASGRPLGDVLDESGLTAGDFVRWARQVVDFAGQVAQAAGPGPLRTTCREVVDSVRRGVVDAAPLED